MDIAVDMVEEGLVTPRRRCCRSSPRRSTSCCARLRSQGAEGHPGRHRGLPASPGAASGQAVFTADDAVAWSQQGKRVMLVRRETVPDDIHGMSVAQGILTATGGMTSHAAVVGRQMGKPSVVGAGELDIDEQGRSFTVKGQTVKEGDWISIDGITGEVMLAKLATAPSEILQVIDGTLAGEGLADLPKFEKLLGGADEVRRLGVRANADSPTRPRSPSSSAPAASGCAAPSTCSSARAGCRSCSG